MLSKTLPSARSVLSALSLLAAATLSSCCWFCPSRDASPSQAYVTTELLFEPDEASQARIERMSDDEFNSTTRAIWARVGTVVPRAIFPLLTREPIATNRDGSVDRAALHAHMRARLDVLGPGPDPEPAPICYFDRGPRYTIDCSKRIHRALVVGDLVGDLKLQVEVEHDPIWMPR